jgi:hypothetical protein
MNEKKTNIRRNVVIVMVLALTLSTGFILGQYSTTMIDVPEPVIIVDALYGVWFKQYTDGVRVRCNATIYGVDENNTIYHGKTVSDLWGSFDGWSTSGFYNLKPFMHLKFCLSIYVNNTSWNSTDGTYYEVNKTLIVGGNMVISVWHDVFNHYGYIVMSSLMGTEWWN